MRKWCLWACLIVIIMLSGSSQALVLNYKVAAKVITNQDIWSMYHGDSRHTGRIPFNTSDNPGRIKWYFKTNGSIAGSPVLDYNGNIYFGSTDGYLYSLNSAGELRWKYKANGAINSTPLVYENKIFFGTSNGTFYCLDFYGNLIWKLDIGGRIEEGANVDNSRGIIYFTSTKGYVYAVNTNGNIIWKKYIAEGLRSSPAIDKNGTIYVGNLYAFHPNGSLKWKFLTYSPSYIGNPVIDDDGIIYTGSGECYIYAIYPNGTLKWNKLIAWSRGSYYATPSIGYDGNLYLGVVECGRGYLVVLNSSSGEIEWSYPFIGKIGYIVNSPILDSAGNVYILLGSSVYCINANNRTAKWKCFVACDDYEVSEHTSFGVGFDGTIYVGCNNNEIYGSILCAIGKGVGSFPYPPSNATLIKKDKYVEIKWDPPEYDGDCGIIGYRIYKTNTGKKWVCVAEVPNNTYHFVDKNITVGWTYYYLLSTVNEVGESPFYTYLTLRWVNKITRPSPPKNLRAIVKDGYVLLTWEPPDSDGGKGLCYYEVYGICEDCGSGDKLLARIKINTAFYTNMSYNVTPIIKSGKTYSFYVIASNGWYDSELSNIVKVSLKQNEQIDFSSYYICVSFLLILLVLIVSIIVYKKMKKRKYLM